MMTGRLTEHVGAMDDAPALRIVGSESQRFHARQSHRSGTHGAGLQADPDRASVEPRLAELQRRGPDRNDFRVRGWIEAPAHRVARLGDDVPALRDDGPDRHFAVLRRFAGEIERSAHRRREGKALS